MHFDVSSAASTALYVNPQALRTETDKIESRFRYIESSIIYSAYTYDRDKLPSITTNNKRTTKFFIMY